MWRLKKPDQNIPRNTTESIVLDEAVPVERWQHRIMHDMFT